MDVNQNLNEFLADLNLFYRKLQNYHWNVEGADFFEVHAKLEELYNEINISIDEIAEHILILGGQPLGTLKDYIQISNIEEAENIKIRSNKIYQTLIKDYGLLLNKVVQIKEQADNQKQHSTSSLMDKYIESYSKIIWMIKQTAA